MFHKKQVKKWNWWRLAIALGYNISNSLTGIQLIISKHGTGFRLDIIFIGIIVIIDLGG